MCRKSSVFVVMILFLSVISFAQSKVWQGKFPDPIRTVPVDTPAKLTAAIANALPGDNIVLADAVTFKGVFTFTKAGTETNPILVTSDGQASVNGSFKLTNTSPHTYIVGNYGIKFFQDDPLVKNALITLQCTNCGAINNFIKNTVGGNVGIGAWNTGNQIVYGNIIIAAAEHGIYTQNNYTKYGYKRFAMNYVADAALTTNTYNFHAYGENVYVSGFWLEKNIFENGQVLIGSRSTIEPDHDLVFKDNFFYKAALRPGYHRPTFYDATGNYLGRCGLVAAYTWGSPESVFPQFAKPSTFKNNTVVFPTGFNVGTNSYAATCSPPSPSDCVQKSGVSLIPGTDFDNNVYIPEFKGWSNIDGVSSGCQTLSCWQQKSKMEASSTIAATEPLKSTFLQNEYDSTLGFLVVYNWTNSASLVYTALGSISVHRAKEPFAAPIATGKNSVTIPLASEFETFLVKTISIPPPPPYTHAQIQQDLQACLDAAKLQPTSTLKYRSLRDCVQKVVDKLEDYTLR
jgi:hypothetical protein